MINTKVPTTLFCRLFIICFLLILLSPSVHSTDIRHPMLTDKDVFSQQKIQHFHIETYQDTGEGVTSVYGYNFETFFTENWSYLISIYGAVGGNRDRGGYGAALFGLGYFFPLTSQTGFTASCQIGSGGGGAIPAGGGFALRSHVGLSHFINSRWGIDLQYGDFQYPNTQFKTSSFTVGVIYRHVRFLVKDDS